LGFRLKNAIRRASTTKLACMCAFMLQPTIARRCMLAVGCGNEFAFAFSFNAVLLHQTAHALFADSNPIG
jgi:hypothetical protein